MVTCSLPLSAQEGSIEVNKKTNVDTFQTFASSQIEKAKTISNSNLKQAIHILDDLLDQGIAENTRDSITFYIQYRLSLYLMMINRNLESKEMIEEIIPYYKDREPKKMAALYTRMGSIETRLGNYDKAVDFLNQAEKLCIELDLKISLGLVYLNLSDLYVIKSNYIEAYKKADLSLKTFQQTGRLDFISSAQTLLGYISLILKDYTGAQEYFDLIFEKSDSIKNKNFLVRPVLFSGILNYELGNIEQAKKQFEQGLSQMDSLGNFPDRAILYRYVAKIALGEKDHVKAESYIKKAIHFAESHSNKRHLFESKLFLAELENLTDPNKANIPEVKEVFEWAIANGDYDMLRSSSAYLSDYYSNLKNYKKAMDYKSIYADASEKKLLTEKLNELTLLQEKNKYQEEVKDKEQKEKQMELQLNSDATIRQLLYGSVLILTLMSSLLYYYYRQKNNANNLLRAGNKELRAAEEILESKNKELEKYIESNIQLEQFAHVASHDLRAPIVNINNFSNLLQKKEQGNLSEDQKKYVHYIQSNGEQMLELVTDLLEYSKINSQKINPSEIELQSLIDQVLNSVKIQSKAQNVRIHVQDKLPRITADEVKLKRVLQNLVSNAIKFSDKEKDSYINIEFQDKPTHWEFKISDNGIGIEDEYLQSIFHPYVRLHNRSQYEGTGLGLSVCQKIIDQHGGDITCSSTFGQGSIFTFSISKQIPKNPNSESIQKYSS